MAMTDRERVVNRLKRLIKAAHNENYDFIYIPVGTAKLIVKMLEEQVRNYDETIKQAILLGDHSGTQFRGVRPEGPEQYQEADVH